MDSERAVTMEKTITRVEPAKLMTKFIGQALMTPVQVHIHAEPEELQDLDFESLFDLAKNVADGSTLIVDRLVKADVYVADGSNLMVDCLIKPELEVSQGVQPSVYEVPRPRIDVSKLQSIISEVCCQITCKALHDQNVQGIMTSLFQGLSSYSWASKAVLTLSAFALYYADYWHLAQPSSKLTVSMAILRGVQPAMSNPLDPLKIQIFALLNGMVKATVDMTKYIVKAELDCKTMPEMSRFFKFSECVNDVTRAILWCSNHFSGLISGVEDCKVEKLTGFAQEVQMIHQTIKQQYIEFKQKKEEISERKRLQYLFAAPNDTVDLIRAFFSTEDNRQLLLKGSTKATVDALRRNKVLLLISDMNISEIDIAELHKIYVEAKFKEEKYEIVWIPLVEETTIEEKLSERFLKFQELMPWYSPVELTVINRAVISIVKENWNFRQESMVVVLDEYGQVENQNAMNLIRIWGWQAFPFNKSKRDTLWNKSEISWFDLLVTDQIFTNITEAIKAEKYIFLYGCEESNLVQEIEGNLKRIITDVASFTCFKVGKGSLFWGQLENCMLSKLQAKADFSDTLLREILQLYTSFKRNDGFAVLSHGSRVVINSSLRVTSKVVKEYSSWKMHVKERTFHIALKEYHDKLFVEPLCRHISLPCKAGHVIESVKCLKCSLTMSSTLTYECCHGNH